jgi:LysW-gamma-L-alpha-aminoadipyl-6-phosphate/LysW-L-glutamyl-5-phosphate reductase
MHRIAILHGAGYGGGELIRLLLGHPAFDLVAATSRTFAGQPVSAAHPHLSGTTDLCFSDEAGFDATGVDAAFIAAEHGSSARAVAALDAAGYAGRIVDLSADFRFQDAAIYPAHFGFAHPCPDRLADFAYSIPEVHGALPEGTRAVANPGCFATAITLALWPFAQQNVPVDAYVTALTGASGSGARPSATTHFPTREGNVRAYKVLQHQHQPEVENTLGAGVCFRFVPVSGPWTRGIWGTAHVTLPEGADPEAVRGWFEAAYPSGGAVRLWPSLPELRASVGTPFCDLGLAVQGRDVVVGFALDNLLKGAASQALQNLNLLFGLDSMTGLVPARLSVAV